MDWYRFWHIAPNTPLLPLVQRVAASAALPCGVASELPATLAARAGVDPEVWQARADFLALRRLRARLASACRRPPLLL